MDIFALLVVLIFALALIFIGWSYGDSSNSDQFNIANWQARLLQVTFGAFTVVGAGELLGVTAFAYDLGYWVNALTIGFAVGAVLLIFFGQSARNIASTENLYSLPDYVNFLYGKNASLITTTTSFFALSALLLIQFVVGGIAIATITGTSTLVGIFISTTVVATYVSLGGYKGILATDIVQGIAMMMSLIALIMGAFFFVPISPLTAEISVPIPRLTDEGILAAVVVFFVSGTMAISGGADVWQRLLSAESESSAKKGLTGTAILFILFGILVYLLAVQIMAVNPAEIVNPNDSFIDYIQTDLHPAFKYIALLGLFAALVSTADAELLVIGLMLSKEANRWGYNKTIEPKDTRIGIIIIATILGVLGYLFQNSLVDIFSYLLNLLMITGPIAWLCMMRRGNDLLICLCAIVAWVIFFYLVLTNQILDGFKPLLIPAPFLVALLLKSSKASNG